MLLLLSTDIFSKSTFSKDVQEHYQQSCHNQGKKSEKCQKNSRSGKSQGNLEKKSGTFSPKKLIVMVNVLKFLTP